MFWADLKYTFRIFRRERLHALINLFGLTIGLACGIIVIIFLNNELSYEAYNVKADRIYRVSQNFITSGKPKRFSWTSPSLGPKLFMEYPQIETFTRLKNAGRVLFRFNGKIFYEDHVAFADTNFFKVFTHQFIYGNPANCLLESDDIVLTEDLWHKYFGNENPVGKELVLENQYPVKVSAVIGNPPSNTHFYHTAYISYLGWDRHSKLPSLDWSLFEINDQTFLLFRKEFDKEAFYKKWPDFYKKYIEEDARLYGQVFEPIFQKLKDIHYHSDLPTNYTLGNRTFFIAVVSTGIFLLLLAGINYTNLATARSVRRIRDFGIHKVFGAGSGDLMIRMLLESMLMAFVSLILAFGLVEYLFEFTGFSNLIGVRMSYGIYRNRTVLITSIGMAILVGAMSDLYPAIHFSGISLIRLRKGSLSEITSVHRPTHQGLIVFQMVLAVVAITFTVLMRQQIRFMEDIKLGFDKEAVLLVPIRDSVTTSNIPVISEELRKFSSVEYVSSGVSYPGFPGSGLYTFEGDNGMEEHNLPVLFADFDYLNTLGIKLLIGRDFDRTRASDREKSIIINQALARFMHWKEPLGKKIRQGNHFDATVIGVVEDFNFRSLHYPLEPLMIRLQNRSGGNLIIKTSGNETGKLLSYLEKKFSELVPGRPFEYEFLSDSFDNQYARDERQTNLIGIFSGLCIFIACLGLFALVSYSAEKRTKEIGIRKTNGAVTGQLVFLFIREYLLLSFMAIVISTPLIIWIFRLWLKEFPYRTGLHAVTFVLTYSGVLLVTILTVIYHSVKAARSNPAASLRYE